jgi:hypothetical protein
MTGFDRGRPVTLNDLRPVAPQVVTAEEKVLIELENTKAARLQVICEDLKTRLLGNDAAEGRALEKQPTETRADHRQRVAQAIQTLAEEVKHAATPLSNDYAAVIQKHGARLDADRLSQVFHGNFHQSMDDAVKNQVESILGTLQNEAQRLAAQKKHQESQQELQKIQAENDMTQRLMPDMETIKQVLQNPSPSKTDTARWVKAAESICGQLGEPHSRELEKSEKINFKNAREFMGFARVAGLVSTVSSHIVAIASFSLTSFSNAAWICSGAMLGNMAVNGMINYARNKKLADLQGTVSQNVGEATSMAGVVLWTGMMHTVMQELSSFFLFNRHNTQSLGNTKSTTVEHTLKLIRDVAALVYKDSADRGIDAKQFLQMDTRVNSAWSQAQPGINSYLNRFRILPGMMMNHSVTAGIVAQMPLLAELTKGIS